MLVKSAFVVLVIFALHDGSSTNAVPCKANNLNYWKIIKRDQWGARPPTGERGVINGTVNYLIIHHSYIPPAAWTTRDCVGAMKYMQDLHIDTNGWADIGYTFAICGDGNVYEGRGFNVVGAHSPRYNDKSIGLLLIGDWRFELPSPKMLHVAHAFIDYTIKSGHLSKDYIMHGHRQVRNNTQCPGNALYAEIQKWPHWQEVE